MPVECTFMAELAFAVYNVTTLVSYLVDCFQEHRLYNQLINKMILELQVFHLDV